ncbi:18S rRNA guanine-N7-methyltransferase bud23 [Hondaea fermentalgiana]|uniref:18S rRNA guanine-N7-methyltransferase bud23 n=1 Tax=Hondaea fermentalgiana TaxID=2315210 RepID=A0A2R5GPW7_9STRA|nr:18S rRNA guanine-N7-methyltransferase bud23 [Hondaea fermentalgiana]|eukprot:GBG30391.1 18S rRNA guanine-N7-methyltransferase bud23 [Hondaea fermentalgiana]
MSRPEHVSPPELFYNEREASKYARSTRMMQIQSQISERALELLNLPDNTHGLLLDVGCGTGMSGSVIEENGHAWIGVDISKDMLDIAATNIKDEGSDGDVVHRDMGTGLGFRGGVFDGAISISAVQWLCYSSHKEHVPKLRLKRFFQELYGALRRGARAVLQLYPETPQQMELITSAAMAVGFTGGVVVDYPNSAKAKKFYLVLSAGQPTQLPRGKDGAGEERPLFHPGRRSANADTVDYESERRGFRGKKRSRNEDVNIKSREWVMNKKDRQRRQGKEVARDSKYSGRRRKGKF